MELKDQVASLESSKRLKELGVKQESLFYWYRWTDTFNRQFGELPDEKDNNILGAPSIQPVPLSGITDRFSAFTVAELGWLTPYYNSISFYQWDENEESGYGCHFNNPAITEEYFATSKTEAEARALMLIYLLEHRPTQNQQ